MKISNIFNNTQINPYQKINNRCEKSHISTNDTVEFSSEALELLSNDEIRHDKVAQIKNQIALGDYKIHSTDIVDKMIGDMRYI